jgi:hypothetical protein
VLYATVEPKVVAVVLKRSHDINDTRPDLLSPVLGHRATITCCGVNDEVDGFRSRVIAVIVPDCVGTNILAPQTWSLK